MANNKQLNKLDPKLKEKYERVMNTPTHASKKPMEPTKPTPQYHTEKPVAAPKTTKHTEKGSSSFLTYIFILLGILFFIGYSIFWLKYFKVPLPF